jgi:hypothetical protein
LHCNSTAQVFETVANSAWDHVCSGVGNHIQGKRLMFLDIYDMSSLRIQSLKGARKEPSAYDKVAVMLNVGGYQIQNNVEIFGMDNTLVKWF